jgi:hypothetical protein
MDASKLATRLQGPIVSDDEIVGTANAIVRTYGKTALIEAKSRAEMMKKLGDNHSFETWSRIAAAIEESH